MQVGYQGDRLLCGLCTVEWAIISECLKHFPLGKTEYWLYLFSGLSIQHVISDRHSALLRSFLHDENQQNSSKAPHVFFSFAPLFDQTHFRHKNRRAHALVEVVRSIFVQVRNHRLHSFSVYRVAYLTRHIKMGILRDPDSTVGIMKIAWLSKAMSNLVPNI